jgi:hypothetical protein
MIKTKLAQTTRQFAKISNIRKFSNISKLSEADKGDKKTTTHFGFQQIPEDIKETLGKTYNTVFTELYINAGNSWKSIQ